MGEGGRRSTGLGPTRGSPRRGDDSDTDARSPRAHLVSKSGLWVGCDHTSTLERLLYGVNHKDGLSLRLVSQLPEQWDGSDRICAPHTIGRGFDTAGSAVGVHGASDSDEPGSSRHRSAH